MDGSSIPRWPAGSESSSTGHLQSGATTVRAVAVAAPHLAKKFLAASAALTSATPFSLLNAMRGAIARIDQPASAWARSNWKRPAGLPIFMADDLRSALEWTDAIIDAEQPNLFLIGAMSLALPGAIAIAKRVRERLGETVTIVLGGKHVTETLWADGEATIIHPAAPYDVDGIALFDLLVSGDGEEVIAEIGEVVAAGYHGTAFERALVRRLERARGSFVALFKSGESVISRGTPIDHEALPFVHDFYPVNAKFGVFGGAPTAHLYSYTSRGCVMRCGFCSENALINGPVNVAALEKGADLLAAQVEHLNAVYGQQRIAGFVEDSILLQAHGPAWLKFADQIERRGARMPFGAQLTVDIVLDARRREALQRLASVGLEYVFMGIETANEAVAASMSKNTARRSQRSWSQRSRAAIASLSDMGVSTGVSVLFGLGEDRDDREAMFMTLRSMREELGQPRVVSLNWATRHPMRDPETGNVDYQRWGVDAGDPRAPMMAQLFGEASVNQAFVAAPTMGDLQHIAHRVAELELAP